MNKFDGGICHQMDALRNIGRLFCSLHTSVIPLGRKP